MTKLTILITSLSVLPLIAHLLLQRELRLPLNLPDVVHRQPVPLVLPGPRLPVRPHHRFPQRHIVDKLLQLRLHPPVTELHPAQLVRTHQRHVPPGGLRLPTDLVPILRQPVLPQRTPARLLRAVQRRIFLPGVIRALQRVLHDVDDVHHPVPQVPPAQLEHILLVAIVREVIRLNLQRKLLHEGARVAGLRVRVRIPRFLLHREGTLRKEALDPTRQVAAHVVDLARVLTAATARAIRVRFVDDDFNAAAGATAFVAGFFLEKNGEREGELSFFF